MFRPVLRVILPCMMAVSVQAADYSDPSWPCIQRKVETLSAGLMWPYAFDEAPLTDADLSGDIRDLADQLVLRRVTLEEAEVAIADFAARHPDATQGDYGRIFERLFNRVSQNRTQVMAGISRYSFDQIALAEKIDASRAMMVSLEEAENPDFDKLDALEEQIDWDQRIFTDRARSLTYVCETPVLLEKRTYALGQLLLQFAPED